MMRDIISYSRLLVNLHPYLIAVKYNRSLIELFKMDFFSLHYKLLVNVQSR